MMALLSRMGLPLLWSSITLFAQGWQEDPEKTAVPWCGSPAEFVISSLLIPSSGSLFFILTAWIQMKAG